MPPAASPAARTGARSTRAEAEERAAPAALGLGKRQFVAMMASLMALNALAIDTMLPAFPAIRASLGIADANAVQFVISVYLFGSGLGALAYGPLADRYGRKPIVLGALVAYAGFALMCAFAGSFPLLLAGRLLQGLAAAALAVVVVSIIRDRFSGDQMASLLSLIFIIFMAVPAIAPLLGQWVAAAFGWRAIFYGLAGVAFLVMLWVSLKLPETLTAENTVPIDHRSIATVWHAVVTNRVGLFYILGAGTIMGALFGFINSAQQIFADVFGRAELFPYAFAVVAGSMAVANFTNSRIVERFGARRVSHSAVFAFIVLSLGQIAADLFAPRVLPLFVALIAVNMSMVAFIGSNFGSIAMQPFARGAGAASSFQTFVRTVLAAGLGALVGQQFDGTALPLAISFLLAGLVCLALVMLAERGRLFTRRQIAPAL